MITVHQVLAGFAPGDAISQEALAIRKVLRDRDFPSEIFVCREFLHSDLRRTAHTLEDLSPADDSIVIYHHSIGSSAGSLMERIQGRKVMIYHNITPPEFVRNHNRDLADQLELGRKQLHQLRGQFELALADSLYNERELREAGYQRTGVLPILLNEEHYRVRPDRAVRKRFDDGRFNVLFVGRLAPNKNPLELIKAFSIFQKRIHPYSRLLLVGSSGGFESYFATLTSMVGALELSEVVFSGHVRQEELLSFYQVGDVFCSLSEHEGFCVPIVEAFRFQVPVIALGAAAVPDTVGRAGIVLESKDLVQFAEAMELVRSSDKARRSLEHKGLARYEKTFAPAVVRRRLEGYIDLLLRM